MLATLAGDEGGLMVPTYIIHCLLQTGSCLTEREYLHNGDLQHACGGLGGNACSVASGGMVHRTKVDGICATGKPRILIVQNFVQK